MVIRPVARRRNLLLCRFRSPSSVVHDWPDAGTNLPLVGANQTRAGRSLGGRILRAAGGTNEGWHESRIPQGRRDGHFRSCLLYGFLTTAANVVLAPIHEKAMPVIATTYEEPDI
jgi:hypothetical protein